MRRIKVGKHRGEWRMAYNAFPLGEGERPKAGIDCLEEAEYGRTASK